MKIVFNKQDEKIILKDIKCIGLNKLQIAELISKKYNCTVRVYRCELWSTKSTSGNLGRKAGYTYYKNGKIVNETINHDYKF